MELLRVEIPLERAVSLVNADPGLEVSREVKLEETGEVLVRAGEKLTLETLNRARSSPVQKFLVQRTEHRWIHPEEKTDPFSDTSVEDTFRFPEQEDSNPYDSYLEIVSATLSPGVLVAVARRTLSDGALPAASSNDAPVFDLTEAIEELQEEHRALRNGLDRLGDGEGRDDGMRFLDGRMVDIEPLELDLSLPEKWLYRLQNYVQKRSELRGQLETHVKQQSEKQRYLDRESSSRSTVGGSDPRDSFSKALDRMEEDDRFGAIEALTRAVEQSSGGDDPLVSRLQKQRQALTSLGGDRKQLLELVFEESETQQQREALLGMVGEEDAPPLERLVDPPASPRLCGRINRYRMRRIGLQARYQETLRRVYTVVYGTLSGEEQNRLRSRSNQPFDQTPPEDVFPDGYLHLPQSSADTIGESGQRDRFRNHSAGTLSARSSLGEAAVEELFGSYAPPEDPEKWPGEILRRLEPVLLELLFPATVNLDRVVGLRRRIEEVLTTQPKPHKLLLQPPSPERYLLVHTYNVALVTQMIGLDLDLMEYQRTQLLLASLYLDAGMGMVPDSLYLNDDELSSQGLKQVRRHTGFSRQMAARGFGPHHTVSRLVHESHERADGSGYPRGLSGEKLHPLTSVLAPADVYASLGEKRTHRDRRSPDEALHTMLKQREQFDPEVLRVLLKQPGFYPDGTVVMLSDNRLGLVQGQDPLDPRRPSLLMLTDADQNKLTDLKKLRLVDHPELRVLRCLRY